MSAAGWLGVALLGGVGASARFAIYSLISARRRGELRLGTLLINVSGSLLLGLLAGLSASGNLLVLAGGATLGSYTTFSTWMLQTSDLVDERRVRAAVLNVLVNLTLGLAAIALGRAIGAWG